MKRVKGVQKRFFILKRGGSYEKIILFGISFPRSCSGSKRTSLILNTGYKWSQKSIYN